MRGGAVGLGIAAVDFLYVQAGLLWYGLKSRSVRQAVVIRASYRPRWAVL